MEATCPKCFSRFELNGKIAPIDVPCTNCAKNGITIPGIIHFEPKTSTLKEAATSLLTYIEENDVYDESCDDGDGHIDQWCSPKFGALTNELKEALEQEKK